MPRKRKGRYKKYRTAKTFGIFFALSTVLSLTHPQQVSVVVSVLAQSFSVFVLLPAILLCFVIAAHVVVERRRNRAIRIRAIRDEKTVEHLAFADPFEFEHKIAILFEGLGYRVDVTKKSGDHGIDILLLDEKGEKAYAQVKRYKEGHMVAEKEVRDFYGSYVDHKGEGFFITTSGFTKSATAWAKERRQRLHLIDREGIKQRFLS